MDIIGQNVYFDHHMGKPTFWTLAPGSGEILSDLWEPKHLEKSFCCLGGKHLYD